MAILAILFTANACTKDTQMELADMPAPKLIGGPSSLSTDVIYYALTGDGQGIEKFSTSDPASSLNSAMITGLQAGEIILGIDFRPATGELFGIGSSSRLYQIDPEYGFATAIGTGPFTPLLEGGVTAFDFNPTVDRIRLITGTGQNLRLNPITGTVAVVDGDINGAIGAKIAAVGYTNSFAGATTTTLYGIDIVGEKLYKIIPPNNGTLVVVGPLVLNNMGEGGFDIIGDVALGLMEVNQKTTLFSVNLQTGSTNVIYKYKKDEVYSGIAIPIQ